MVAPMGYTSGGNFGNPGGGGATGAGAGAAGGTVAVIPDVDLFSAMIPLLWCKLPFGLTSTFVGSND